ncbi:MAG: hypothetical protein HZB53_13495 [Chloroflexi bacterium]|nr:hypothetical protein [Chloroflexota bacterium]
MFAHARPARPGDYCVLLAADSDLPRLHARLAQLQRRCGGHRAEPVHLTCQRFVAPPEALEEFLSLFRPITLACARIIVEANSLVKWQAPGRRDRSLRWGITLTPALRAFAAMSEQVLVAAGGAPLYTSGWLPSLVTALEGIEDISFDPNQLTTDTFPYELFEARRVLVTRIAGAGEYVVEHELVLGS